MYQATKDETTSVVLIPSPSDLIRRKMDWTFKPGVELTFHTFAREYFVLCRECGAGQFHPRANKVHMQNDTIYRQALERCRDSIGVIRECDEILEITTPLPRKPQTDRGALQLAKDLAYLAWDLEQKAMAFIDGKRYYAAYLEATAEYEQAKRQLALVA